MSSNEKGIKRMLEKLEREAVKVRMKINANKTVLMKTEKTYS